MSAAPKCPAAPRDLAAAGRTLWRTVLDAWTLDARELLVLADACRQADRAAEARRIIAADGLVVAGATGGSKANPAVQIEATAAALSGRLLASIGVKVTPERDSRGRFSNSSLRAV